jgi:hypothetical protein
VRKEHLEIVLRFIYTDVIDVDNIPGFPPSGTHVTTIFFFLYFSFFFFFFFCARNN